MQATLDSPFEMRAQSPVCGERLVRMSTFLNSFSKTDRQPSYPRGSREPSYTWTALPCLLPVNLLVILELLVGEHRLMLDSIAT